MSRVRVLRVVVASPGDVQAERNLVRDVADELNQGIAADRGLRLEVIRWETDAFPNYHPGGPQGLIDPVLGIEDSDFLIGIFHKRFGTAGKDGQTGTEHEIRKAIEARKKKDLPHIMLYFKTQEFYPKTRKEYDQFGQVLRFRDDLPEEIFWWEYEEISDFERLLRGHLTRIIREYYPPARPPLIVTVGEELLRLIRHALKIVLVGLGCLLLGLGSIELGKVSVEAGHTEPDVEVVPEPARYPSESAYSTPNGTYIFSTTNICTTEPLIPSQKPIQVYVNGVSASGSCQVCLGVAGPDGLNDIGVVVECP